MTIATLIDKQDNVEIIRDQIAAILAVEVASQMALATTAAKDPLLWKLNVYLERSNPWEQWLNAQTDTSPIVNVWWTDSTFDDKASNVVERQKSQTVYNIDCYGYGKCANNPGGGHYAGDETAAKEAHRALRLVRNILMSAEYTYLGLRPLVWRRLIQSITVFQPQQDSNTAQQVVGSRLALRVEFNEFSPQIPLETLELLTTEVFRAEDGQIVAEADYSYPLP